MMRIAVKGIGLTGGFGSGVAEFRQALEHGKSRVGSFTVPTGQGPVELPAMRADTDRLDDFIPRRNLRRVDHYSRMALLGASLALADAGPTGHDRGRTGVIVASGYGGTAATFAFLDSFIDDGDVCASPTHFANSVHNAAAANISIQLGITGPSLTVSQFGMSVPVALLTACQWLAEERVDTVLLGGVDELSDLICYTWYRQRNARLETAGAAMPGEGAAFLLLSRADGSCEGYCAIEAVETGAVRVGVLALPQEGLVLVGADGQPEEVHRSKIAPQAAFACYTPLYGCMPTAPAFDLAAAALMLKEGTIFPSPRSAEGDVPGKPTGKELFPENGRITCLALSGGLEYGLATLARL